MKSVNHANDEQKNNLEQLAVVITTRGINSLDSAQRGIIGQLDFKQLDNFVASLVQQFHYPNSTHHSTIFIENFTTILGQIQDMHPKYLMLHHLAGSDQNCLLVSALLLRWPSLFQPQIVQELRGLDIYAWARSAPGMSQLLLQYHPRALVSASMLAEKVGLMQQLLALSSENVALKQQLFNKSTEDVQALQYIQSLQQECAKLVIEKNQLEQRLKTSLMAGNGYSLFCNQSFGSSMSDLTSSSTDSSASSPRRPSP